MCEARCSKEDGLGVELGNLMTISIIETRFCKTLSEEKPLYQHLARRQDTDVGTLGQTTGQ